MNVLVVTGHPRARSLCAALAQAYAQGARDAGCAVRELSLATLRFDPDVHTASPGDQPLEPDLQAALAALEWAGHVVIVYPAWWGTAPARLKGLLDRILLPGRAFCMSPDGRPLGLLGGRTAHLLTTLDTPGWVYRFVQRAGGHQALRRSTLGVCGIRVTRIVSFAPVHCADAAQCAAWLRRARELGRSLRAGPLRVHQRWAGRAAAWLRALRLQFYPMSWMGYTLGALAAGGAMNTPAYAFGYASLFLVKAATVFSNERHDFASDRINRHAGPFNGGSRVLVDGVLQPAQLRAGTLLGLGAAVLCALFALSRGGSAAAVAVMALTSAAALAYTAPPLRLSWRGWGEVDVAATHSIGVVLWGYVLQDGHAFDALPWALSLPLGLSVLPAIILSSVPDIDADRQAGKRTLAVRVGARAARALAATTALAANVALLAVGHATGGALAGLLPWSALHAGLLVAMLYAPGAARRGVQPAIVCALAFIMWFVGWPLWRLAH